MTRKRKTHAVVALPPHERHGRRTECGWYETALLGIGRFSESPTCLICRRILAAAKRKEK